jgi:hypothetical protein
MRLLKVAFMLIILVDIFIIFIALILLNPLLVLLFIVVSSVLKSIHNQLNGRRKLNKIYRSKFGGLSKLI